METDTQGEGHVTGEAEIGVVELKPTAAKMLATDRSWKRQGKILPKILESEWPC